MKERVIIAAVAADGSIGNEGGLVYRLKDDLERFKILTTGNVVIMGRKTFESIGRPLPNRENIVVTSGSITLPYESTHLHVVKSLADAFRLAETLPGEKAYVIGGGQIYKEAMDWCTRLEITEIFAQPAKADTFFPEIDVKVWRPTYRSEKYFTEEIPIHRYVTYKRNLVPEVS